MLFDFLHDEVEREKERSPHVSFPIEANWGK